MWTRYELKTKAKEFLKRNYITAFFVSLIIMFATEGGGNKSHNTVSNPQMLIQNGQLNLEAMRALIPVISIVTILIVLIVVLLRIFVGYILEVGGRNYFLRGTEREVKFQEITFGFNSEYYGNIILTMFIKGVYNFLWTLLLIIPGIIKYYAYSMVPYILADNPNIESGRAIDLSKSMTDGQKWDMFILDLSFIGWYIIGAILFGIGIYFVNPYVDATKAQLYVKLRANAVQNNLCSPDELCFTLDNASTYENWYDEE